MEPFLTIKATIRQLPLVLVTSFGFQETEIGLVFFGVSLSLSLSFFLSASYLLLISPFG